MPCSWQVSYNSCPITYQFRASQDCRSGTSDTPVGSLRHARLLSTGERPGSTIFAAAGPRPSSPECQQQTKQTAKGHSEDSWGLITARCARHPTKSGGMCDWCVQARQGSTESRRHGPSHPVQLRESLTVGRQELQTGQMRKVSRWPTDPAYRGKFASWRVQQERAPGKKPDSKSLGRSATRTEADFCPSHGPLESNTLPGDPSLYTQVS